MADCPRQNRWIGGCQFEARYDYGAVSNRLDHVSATGMDPREVFDAFREKTYVADVCTRCGKVVKRDEL